MAKITRHGGASNKDATSSTITHPKRIRESEEVESSEQLTELVEDNYDEWTAAQLRDELTDRELPTSGKKSELIERLREDDAEDAESDEDENELEPTS